MWSRNGLSLRNTWFSSSLSRILSVVFDVVFCRSLFVFLCLFLCWLRSQIFYYPFDIFKLFLPRTFIKIQMISLFLKIYGILIAFKSSIRMLFYSQKKVFPQAVLTRFMVKGHLLRLLLWYSQHVLQTLFFSRGTDEWWKHVHTTRILLVYNWFIYITLQLIIEIDNYKIK